MPAARGLASDEPPATLRERVTSKGGTTHAAVTSLQAKLEAARALRCVASKEDGERVWSVARALGLEVGSGAVGSEMPPTERVHEMLERLVVEGIIEEEDGGD